VGAVEFSIFDMFHVFWNSFFILIEDLLTSVSSTDLCIGVECVENVCDLSFDRDDARCGCVVMANEED